jgi:secernin
VCDTFCIRRPDGMLFAKSSDRPVDEVQVLEWLPARPSGSGLRTTYVEVPEAGSAAVLGSRPTWMWGLEHGVNEHRVAIGNERVWTVDDPRLAPPGLIGMDLVRLGLERAASADRAVDVITSLLERHGQGGSGEEGGDEPYGSSFLVADPSAGWVLETSGRSWVAAPVQAGAAISNRLTLRSDWTRSSADVEPGSDWDDRRSRGSPTGIADHRLAATRRCIADGRADARQVVRVLRDHGSGPWGSPGDAVHDPPPPPPGVHDDWSGITVCMHVRGYQCTTASLVADLPADPDEPLRAWAALGSPCASVYLPSGWSTVGPWSRASSATRTCGARSAR